METEILSTHYIEYIHETQLYRDKVLHLLITPQNINGKKYPTQI